MIELNGKDIRVTRNEVETLRTDDGRYAPRIGSTVTVLPPREPSFKNWGALLEVKKDGKGRALILNASEHAATLDGIGDWAGDTTTLGPWCSVDVQEHALDFYAFNGVPLVKLLVSHQTTDASTTL